MSRGEKGEGLKSSRSVTGLEEGIGGSVWGNPQKKREVG